MHERAVICSVYRRIPHKKAIVSCPLMLVYGDRSASIAELCGNPRLKSDVMQELDTVAERAGLQRFERVRVPAAQEKQGALFFALARVLTFSWCFSSVAPCLSQRRYSTSQIEKQPYDHGLLE